MRNGQWPIGARIGVFLLTGFVFGCSGNTQLVRHQTPLGSSGPESVAIADMQYLHVLEETPHDQWFERGNGVGFLQHRGGFIEPSEAGGRVHSKEVVLSMEERFKDYLEAWHQTQLNRLLREANVGVTGEVALAHPPELERTRLFGAVSESGTDNVNIPHMVFRPEMRWNEAKAWKDKGHQSVLVPVVAYYYAHNPGWFYGQTWGCSSGARARLVWLLYDTSDGGLIGWWDLETFHQEEKVRQPEEGLIEQLAAKVLSDLEELMKAEVRWR